MPIRVERFTFRKRECVPLAVKGIQRLVLKEGPERKMIEEISEATGGAIFARGVGIGLEGEPIPGTKRVWIAEGILEVEKERRETIRSA